MKIVITPFFSQDLAFAYQWYESRKLGLGENLIEDIEKVLDLITQYPKATRKGVRKYRSAFLSKFPYGIVYEVKRDLIVVVALYHNSRKSKFR
ncbi:MAG: type II toxin-antitoxin system RelE/ParE family toxin [Bacteroidia bacterium]